MTEGSCVTIRNSCRSVVYASNCVIVTCALAAPGAATLMTIDAHVAFSPTGIGPFDFCTVTPGSTIDANTEEQKSVGTGVVNSQDLCASEAASSCATRSRRYVPCTTFAGNLYTMLVAFNPSSSPPRVLVSLGLPVFASPVLLYCAAKAVVGSLMYVLPSMFEARQHP